MHDGNSKDHSHWVRELLAQYERPLLQYAVRLLRNDQERARDVVQDTFLKLVSTDQSTVADHAAEWLFTVCRNRCLDVLRKERRMSTMTEKQERALEPSTEQSAPRAEQSEANVHMLQALEKLPERQQEVIRLKFLGGLSYKEISRVTELTVGNVGFLIHTGLKTIRENLQRQHAADTRSNLGVAR